MSDILLYTTEDGRSRLELKLDGGSAWLTQSEIAELFQTSVPNISLHVKNLFEEAELEREATVQESLRVQMEGGREVSRTVMLHNLDLILAIGYRVKSPRGTQFRRWVTVHLREFLVKGFVMDDERLKDPAGFDHFDELLERIREIRASEKRFYQKVRDLFTLSSDYRGSEKETGLFFAETQNKLLYAATGHTAAELIVKRADAGKANMGLTSWKGSRVRKQDILTAKNYLTQDEIDTLNRLVVIFLEQAELRVKKRKDLTLAYWRQNVDQMLAFNEQTVLDGAGSISRDRMERVAIERYGRFDADRKQAEARAADAEDLRQLEDLEENLKKKRKKKPR